MSFKVRAGVVGMQTEGLSTLQDFNKAGTILEGGGYQYQSIEYLGENYNKYLEPIKEIQIELK
ncbi:hypothetical protein [Dysgonomonas sp. 25]|uniref:hypothetical protein n=1 Tax=Dysgonomonas sp. 25 TaxID=2302933 RepID=UPI0013CFB451|nr:hypothetical protein [Dysgonomonas sp. 25]NDV70038.1 hypothetical protein [Dysgonomonas sp. 25]